MSLFTPLPRISVWQRCLLASLLPWAGALNAHLAPREVAFIDSGVTDWQVLAEGVKPGVEVVLLDGRGDGLAQMADWARGRFGYSAIHVLSHGSPGTVRLGAFGLNRETLGERAGELAAIGAALNEGGDLLLYGCNVAAGPTGADFVQRLARVTGADVAASEDLTGSAATGGDWHLEYVSGTFIPTAVMSESALIAYRHSLATYTVTNTGDSGAGTLRNAASSAASGDIIQFASSINGSTITLGTPITLAANITLDASLLTTLTITGSTINLAGNLTVSNNASAA
ncbi:MAG: DUF4347 domain-containing protein [Synechococcaceae cyanobacterium SM1_2_3]|nr:DUF4347 domain-containing protein [Synechococcaceae cyanobacterium SM1_2_3]